MSWQIILILISVFLILAGYLILFILLSKSKKRLVRAQTDIVRMKCAWQESQDVIQRIKFLKESEDLSDEKAREEFFDLIDNWSPILPSGADDPL